MTIENMPLFLEDMDNEDRILWWHIPRAKRRYNTSQTVLTCQAFYDSCQRFGRWDEDAFRIELINRRLVPSNTKKKSGTVRTYATGLISLGLINMEKTSLTITGEDMRLDRTGKNSPANILRHQTLALQFPSEYSIGRSGLDSRLIIKPNLFLLKMLRDNKFKGSYSSPYLADEEIQIILYFAKTLDDYDLCSEYILEFRRDRNLVGILRRNIQSYRRLEQILESKLLSKLGRTGRKATITQPLEEESSLFRSFLKGRSLVVSGSIAKSIMVDPDLSSAWMEIIDRGIEDYIRNPLFGLVTQSEYGSWNGVRTRPTEVVNYKEQSRQSIIRCFNKLIDKIKDEDIYREIRSETGENMATIRSVIDLLLPSVIDTFGQELLACSIDISRCSELEKRSRAYLKDVLNLECYLTGRIRQESDRGNHSDIFVVSPDRMRCGIIDCKSSKKPYTLPIAAHLSMQSYASAYNELRRRYQLPEEAQLKFLCFLSGSFSDNTPSHQVELSDRVKLPVSAISVASLLHINRSSDPEHVFNLFTRGGLI